MRKNQTIDDVVYDCLEGIAGLCNVSESGQE